MAATSGLIQGEWLLASINDPVKQDLNFDQIWANAICLNSTWQQEMCAVIKLNKYIFDLQFWDLHCRIFCKSQSESCSRSGGTAPWSIVYHFLGLKLPSIWPKILKGENSSSGIEIRKGYPGAPDFKETIFERKEVSEMDQTLGENRTGSQFWGKVSAERPWLEFEKSFSF